MRKSVQTPLDLVHLSQAEILVRLDRIESRLTRLEGIVLESLPSAARAKFMDEIMEGESALQQHIDEMK